MSLFGKTVETKQPEPPHGRSAAQPTTSPVSGLVPGVRPATCVIGPKTTAKGDLVGDEDLLVEGTVEGQIRITRDLRVGQSGVVRATVHAAAVVVSGELVGDCTASSRVEIQTTGRLMGNIRAPKIVIAEGAVFRGNSDMSSLRDKGPSN
jgi:cytoskeletal protein CcmA (bactofilin family)